MLEALKAFMPVEEQGLGSLSYTSEQRRSIAKNTRAYQCPVCNQKLKDHEELILQNQKLTEQNQQIEIQKFREDETRDKKKKQDQDEETRNYYIKKSIDEAQVHECAQKRTPIFGVGPEPGRAQNSPVTQKQKKSVAIERADSEQDFDEAMPRERNTAQHPVRPTKQPTKKTAEVMEEKPLLIPAHAARQDRAFRPSSPRLVADNRHEQRDMKRLSDMARALQSIVRNPTSQAPESAKDLLSKLATVVPSS